MSFSKIKSKYNQQIVSTICFSLFSTWILTVPFEGQILYSLMQNINVDPSPFVFASIIAHFIGLLCSGFVIKTQQTAKMIMILSILMCISGSLILFLQFSLFWFFLLIIMSFLAGLFVASIGFYIKHYSDSKQRHKTVADILIYSNILMIIINVITVNISTNLGLGLLIFILIIALFISFHLEAHPSECVHLKLNMEKSDDESNPPNLSSTYRSESLNPNKISGKKDAFFNIGKQNNKYYPKITKPFLLLCLFITIITINSGLMYQVVTPIYSHFSILASYYWAIPYITALFILRNLPKRINQTYILYIAMAMIGLSFLAFMRLEISVLSYLIIDTLMLGAFGVYDLFWWSILVYFFDYSDNPTQLLGVGLSMNVLGILIGGFIGNTFLVVANPIDTSVIALFIIFIVLIILPILNIQLTKLFKNHMFFIEFSRLQDMEQEQAMQKCKYENLLTKKEREVVKLLLKGYTYKAIAQSLFITENTMKYHTKNIYQKLHINSKMELIKLFSELEEKNI